MFVDRIKVFAQGGNGGRGCVSFRREKFVPRGGPDGGDGGRGGNVVLRADVHTDNLANLFYEPIIKAKSGGHGMGKKMHGKGASDKTVNVPIGTVVYRTEAPAPKDEADDVYMSHRPDASYAHPDAATRELHKEPDSAVSLQQLADLAEEGQEFVLCAGGKGGKGNVHFKSARNRAPVQYTEGGEGEQGHFLLELRTIADAALVGYPNAGKSTLLGKISAAHPKVAAYPFTTLRPSVGVVELDDYRRVTVADIPGLIEGAHRNVGLGHDFLRHTTRCRYLLFVLDVAGSEGRHPIEDLQSLRREIDLYDRRLSQRPWCILANKVDLPGTDEHLQALRTRFPGVNIIPISAEKDGGLPELKEHLTEWVAASAAPNESLNEAESEGVTAGEYR
ncbi:MAG: GTPase ObgE [Chthoniobacterales bacterium]|jgi:GTP-binding protein|nr:GTPase ObgE [Chthoniobacterales bacterium]